MMSVGSLLRFRVARAAALVAVLVFGWQSAVQNVAGPALQAAATAAPHTIASPAELTPAHTILPLAPVEVAKPAPPERRPTVAFVAAVPSVTALAVPARPRRDTDNDAARRPAALLSPPYAARGPPLFS